MTRFVSGKFVKRLKSTCLVWVFLGLPVSVLVVGDGRELKMTATVTVMPTLMPTFTHTVAMPTPVPTSIQTLNVPASAPDVDSNHCSSDVYSNDCPDRSANHGSHSHSDTSFPPTTVPTSIPTILPTLAPTADPTAAPTAIPTAVSTLVPTQAPTLVLMAEPTAVADTPFATSTMVPTAITTAAAPISLPRQRYSTQLFQLQHFRQ